MRLNQRWRRRRTMMMMLTFFILYSSWISIKLNLRFFSFFIIKINCPDPPLFHFYSSCPISKILTNSINICLIFFRSQGEITNYKNPISYECLPCAEGCDQCMDSSPCVAALNWPMRTSILALACTVIGLLPPAALFTFKYQRVKVSRKCWMYWGLEFGVWFG